MAVSGAAALAAITACTAVAVLVMGAYHQVEGSPIVRDIGRYTLPVICGLLLTTSVAMLNAAAEVTANTSAPPSAVILLSAVGVVIVTWLRHRRALHDVLLLALCGGLSLVALVLT